MQTQALIFDMDGTMVDSMPWHAKSWDAFFASQDVEIAIEEVMRRTMGRNGLECIRELIPRTMTDEEAWTLVRQKETMYRELFTPVFAEVKGFRAFAERAFGRGLKVGVGTAGDKHNIEFVFSNLKMLTAPNAVVGGDEGLPGKPEPAIFLAAAHRMAVEAKTCIVFEDAPQGIEAARRAGMRAVAICTSHRAEELSGPHVVAQVRDYHELMDNNFLENLHVA